MRFIELSDGVSVNVDSIDLIQRVNDTETAIMVDGEVYTTLVPYDSLRKLLSRQMASPVENAMLQLAKFQSVQTP